MSTACEYMTRVPDKSEPFILVKLLYSFRYEPDLKHTEGVKFEEAMRDLRSEVENVISSLRTNYSVIEEEEATRLVIVHPVNHFAITIRYDAVIVERHAAFLEEKECNETINLMRYILELLAGKLINYYKQSIVEVGVRVSQSYIIVKGENSGSPAARDELLRGLEEGTVVSVLANTLNLMLSNKSLRDNTRDLEVNWGIRVEGLGNARFVIKFIRLMQGNTLSLLPLLLIPMGRPDHGVEISTQLIIVPRAQRDVGDVIRTLDRAEDWVISTSRQLHAGIVELLRKLVGKVIVMYAPLPG
ncbi:hypothetical protein [Pyrodictium abyssi]|uniref:Uncharacterized protein n=1 Tax=Pyrodictium abyssi TaxID=54256 RepID=A0ABM8IW22_9CREN|nr:hypothetical protein PABY_13220 [Pyrodictium abyssi]